MVSEKFLLIINPTSGWGQGKRYKEWLERESKKVCGKQIDVICSSKSGKNSIENLVKRAIKDGYRRVIAATGDGGCNEVVNVLAGSDVSLAIIPIGTANDFAKGINIPQNVKRAFRVAVHGKEVSIDLGRINGRYFVNVASFGFDAQLVRMVSELREQFSFLPSRWLYLLSFLKKINLPLELSSIRINGGKEKRVLGLVITNGPQYGGMFKIAPAASYTDGLLECCLIGGTNVLQVLEKFPKLLNGTHNTFPDVIMGRISSLTVSSYEELDCEVDGEFFEKQKDYIITIHPGILKVVIPQENVIR
ncbi:MAG: diacylglycerol kinase family protein [Candidatus Nealsonbacteria bacterium]